MSFQSTDPKKVIQKMSKKKTFLRSILLPVKELPYLVGF